MNEALLRAANNGHVRCVRILLERGADRDYADLDGDTSLMLAACNKHFEVARQLINHGADVNLRSDYGRTALHMAAWTGHLKMTQLMLDWDCDWSVRDIYGDTAVMLAARGGFLDVLNALMNHGCDIHQCNYEKETALHYAAKNGRLDCMHLLLDAGSAIDAKSVFDYTPLMAALSSCQADSAIMLLDEGADISNPSTPKSNLLTLCLRSSSDAIFHVMQELLVRGIDPNLPDTDGSTLLCDAINSHQTQHVKTLVRGNCDVNQPGRSAIRGTLRKCTPLELAIDRGFVDIVQILLVGGACPLAVKSWTTDVEFLHQDVLQDSVLMELLQSVSHAPRTLLDICRHAIRSQLGTAIAFKIPFLPIPSVLTSYIDLIELEEPCC